MWLVVLGKERGGREKMYSSSMVSPPVVGLGTVEDERRRQKGAQFGRIVTGWLIDGLIDGCLVGSVIL